MSSYYYNDSRKQGSSELVFCIEEYDDRNIGYTEENIDMRLFLFYHKFMKKFVLFGRRQDRKNSRSEYVPFHFSSNNEKAVYDFIQFVINAASKHSITLYNYNNLYCIENSTSPYCYEQLEEIMGRDYELAAYDNETLQRSKIMKHLHMLRNFN